MRYLVLLLFVYNTAAADIGIDAVAISSSGLGYDDWGSGLQIDVDARWGSWGVDSQATFLKHAKITGSGERYQYILMGRKFFDNYFIEAGGEYGGYETRFPNTSIWKKFGFSPGIGIGRQTRVNELGLRYFSPDSTPNKTSVIQVYGEVLLMPSFTLGATVERWQFDFRANRLSGTQMTLEAGWRW